MVNSKLRGKQMTMMKILEKKRHFQLIRPCLNCNIQPMSGCFIKWYKNYLRQYCLYDVSVKYTKQVALLFQQILRHINPCPFSISKDYNVCQFR